MGIIMKSLDLSTREALECIIMDYSGESIEDQNADRNADSKD